MSAAELRKAATRALADADWERLVADVEADGTPDPSRGLDLVAAYLAASKRVAS